LGDRLQVYDPREGRVLAECTVKGLAELPGQRYRVQIDKAVAGIRPGGDHLKADTVFNLSASGEGYVIRNNRFIGQRRYGILVRGGKGRIEGNYINGVRGWGIVLANDPGWPEGPLPFNVVIKGNTVINAGASRECGYREDSGSIVVVNMRAGWELGKGRDIRNIVIEGNKIIDPVTAAIFVGGAKNITILNNEITASESVPLYEKRGSVRVVNCDGVRIDGLKVVDPRPNCIAAVEILADTAADVNSVVIEKLETKLHKDAVRVLDKRKQCRQ
jgi:nitrous oxidase accessory protein NosD